MSWSVERTVIAPEQLDQIEQPPHQSQHEAEQILVTREAAKQIIRSGHLGKLGTCQFKVQMYGHGTPGHSSPDHFNGPRDAVTLVITQQALIPGQTAQGAAPARPPVERPENEEKPAEEGSRPKVGAKK